MHIEVVTLFPKLVSDALGYGVVGRALERELARVGTVDPRTFASDVHKTIDDRPYGGGPGMVMKVEPLTTALDVAKEKIAGAAPVFYLSAQGSRFDQAKARELAGLDGFVLLAGRYEGVDERLITRSVDEELSVGDYVLSGGELAALVVIDAVLRLLPGVLGHVDSAGDDSFVDGLLECPQYTRPEEVHGMRVPEILLTGNHGEVARWRLKQALGRTWMRRPDLLGQRRLTDEEQALLDEFKSEVSQTRRGQ